MTDPKKTSVQQLSELYNVVIGIALSVAIYNTINVEAVLFPLKFKQLPQLAIFLVLIIPFYHGAVRHLFATYVEDGGSANIKNGALLADFVLLFIEGCFFVMMASIIGNIYTLIWIIVALLVLDSVWGFLAWLAFTGAGSQAAEKKWAIINMVCVAVLLFLLILYKEQFMTKPFGLSFLVLLLLIIRTVVDYNMAWNFYFPNPKTKDTPVAVKAIKPDGKPIVIPEGTKITVNNTQTFTVAMQDE